MNESDAVEDLLEACHAGDRAAFDELVSLVYPQLRAIAHRQLSGRRRGVPFDTTGLVNEAYLRLAAKSVNPWKSRGHFFAVASRAMRHILVDYARRRRALKRGGCQVQLTFDESSYGVAVEIETVLLVESVLERLGDVDPRLVRMIECRYFAGLTEEETASALSVTSRTVQRDWKRAKAWLRAELAGVS